jgi:hypothetical protein
MNNLDFGNIAVGAIIVGFLNLVIVILIKTETILKYVERVKSVIRLDYKSRAKRSDDEVRIFKKHELVARERVRHTYITDTIWNCKWTWNWSEKLEPINIKGYCVGDKGRDFLDKPIYFECNHPVNPYYLFPKEEKGKAPPPPSNFTTLAIFCSQDGYHPHRQKRAEFEVAKSITQEVNSEQAFQPIISKTILSNRDVKIAREIWKLRLQFWR